MYERDLLIGNKTNGIKWTFPFSPIHERGPEVYEKAESSSRERWAQLYGQLCPCIAGTFSELLMKNELFHDATTFRAPSGDRYENRLEKHELHFPKRCFKSLV